MVRAIRKNPIMILGICLPFAIATATSLKYAAAMSMEFIAINIVASVVSVLLANKLPYWVRAAVNVGVATLVMMVARSFIASIMPDISNYLGTYIYLLALSGRALLEASEITPKRRVRLGTAMIRALRSAFAHSAVFVFLMLSLALPREYFGSGTIWGQSFSAPIRLNGMLMPFYGFISAGFLIAFLRFIYRGINIFGVKEAEREEIRKKEEYTQIVVRK